MDLLLKGEQEGIHELKITLNQFNDLFIEVVKNTLDYIHFQYIHKIHTLAYKHYANMQNIPLNKIIQG